MHLLVNFSRESVQNRLVASLYKEQLFAELLEEDAGLTSERNRVKALLDAYKEAFNGEFLFECGISSDMVFESLSWRMRIAALTRRSQWTGKRTREAPRSSNAAFLRSLPRLFSLLLSLLVGCVLTRSQISFPRLPLHLSQS